MACVDELPCDDVQLDDAEAAARAGLQSAGSNGLGALLRSRPGTQGAWSCSSAPSLGGAWPACWSSGSRDPPSPSGSRPCSRPGTGRFSPEELACFRRVHTPSSLCSGKAEVYWHTTGDLKRSLSETGWHSLPVSKGKFYTRVPLQDQSSLLSLSNVSKRKTAAVADMLPDEVLTSKVLNEIYPRTHTEKLHIHTDLPPGLYEDRKHEDTDYQLLQHDVRRMANMGGMKSPGHRVTVRVDQTPPRPPKTESVSGTPFKSRSGVGTPSHPPSPMNSTSPLGGTHGGLGATSSGINTSGSALEMMLQLRTRLLEKCTDVQEILDIFASEIPNGQSGVMTKKEWRRSLAKIGLELSKEERDASFKLLDMDNDGRISLVEVQIVIEAAAPVRTLTDLRRRWLASGFNSMCAALHAIEEGGIQVSKKLALREFGDALARVNVFDHSEHMALFNVILDPSDVHSRVSIGELMCAVATVSPSLLLEDVRDRLLRKYGGSIEKAYWDIDADHSGVLEYNEFVMECCRKLDLSRNEAEKVFRMIDVDSSGTISRMEFVSALAMSEPSLFLEDLRQKVRQRFRSIYDIFQKTIAEAHLTAEEEPPKFTLQRFQTLLSELDMSDIDTRVLFALIDSDSNGSLSLDEFLKATRQLAPSCVFENLRLKCLDRNTQICDSFQEAICNDVRDFNSNKSMMSNFKSNDTNGNITVPFVKKRPRSSPMKFEDFCELLQDLNLAQDVNLKVIFDVLDIKNEGLVTLGRLIAALQAGGPGKNVRLTKEEQKWKAEQEIRGCTQSVRRLAGDLKTQVRLGSRGHDGPQDMKRQSSSIEEDDEESEREGFNATNKSSPGEHREQTPPKQKPSMVAKFGSSLFSPNRGKKLLATFQNERKREKHARKTGASPERGGESDTPQKDRQSASQDGDEPMSDSSPGHGPPRLRTVPHHETKAYHVPLVAPKPAKVKAGPGTLPKGALETRTQKYVEDNRQSWGHVWRRLHETGGTDDREVLEKKVHSYYQTATWSLSQDGPLLEQSPSRHLMHRNIQLHHSCLESDKLRSLY